MKKIMGLIFLIALVVILPAKVNAASWGMTYDSTDQDTDGYFTVTLKGFQSDNPNGIESMSTTMTLTNVELVGEPVSSGTWTVVREGNTLNFVTSVAVTDPEFTLATLTFKKTGAADDKCSITFKCNEVEKTVAPKTKTVKNPKTGNVLPYAVIMVGIVMAVGVYYITRSNTKLYKI